MKDKHHTEEAKEKMRLSHAGKLPTFKNKHHTEETKEKMSQAKLGVKLPPFTEEHIKNMIKSHVGFLDKHHTKETKGKLRQAGLGNTNGFKKGHIPWNKNTIKEKRYESVNDQIIQSYTNRSKEEAS